MAGGNVKVSGVKFTQLVLKVMVGGVSRSWVQGQGHWVYIENFFYVYTVRIFVKIVKFEFPYLFWDPHLNQLYNQLNL